MKRIVSGIQPTNDLTLGNYLGSIKQFLKLQNDYEMYIFVADLHSLTTGVISAVELEKNSFNLVKSYLACGLDPNKNILFLQSSISEHTELMYFLMCQTTIGELNRMTQFKDKVARLGKQENGTEKIPTGLLTYPILMAADILLYSPDYVPVGIDQKQHLELTRNLADRLNKKLNINIMKKPEVLVPKHTGRIMDLQDPTTKMSKSSVNKKGVIFLNDPIEESVKKILSAKTDGLNKVNYDLENQPEVANLINIYNGLSDIEINEICERYKNKGYKEFKLDLAQLLESFLLDYQTKFKKWSNNDVQELLKKNNKKAKVIASKMMKEIYKNIGVITCEE